MVVLADGVGVEADPELELLLGLEGALGDVNLVYALLLNFVVAEVPVDVLLVNVADGDGDVFGVAPVGLGDYLALEVDDRGLEEELGIYALAFDRGDVLNLYGLLNRHGDLQLVVASLAGEEFYVEFVCLLGLQHQPVPPLLILVLLGDVLVLRLTYVELVLVYLLPCQILPLNRGLVQIRLGPLGHSQHFQLLLVVKEGQLGVLNKLGVLALVLAGANVDNEGQLDGGLVDEGVVCASGDAVNYKNTHVKGLPAEGDHGLNDVDGIFQDFLLASPGGDGY